MTTAPNGVALEAALDEVERELKVRQRCYPGWISDGRLSKTEAADRGSRMEAASQFLHYMLDMQQAAADTSPTRGGEVR